jgi:four helix bundle protein
MKFKKFEEMIVWQKSQDLTVDIYQVFGGMKDYGFKDQIQRAAVSISNNIAEGYERISNSEFIRFLYIAKGSAGEVRSMLSLALRLGYISSRQFPLFEKQVTEISFMLSALIKSLYKSKS